MATLPADRSKLALAQSNQVPSAVASSSRNINAMTEAYDTIDTLYNFTTGLINQGTLSRLGVINVTDYKADPTGAIDSTAFIQAAIDYATANGYAVVAVGTFRISSKLIIKCNFDGMLATFNVYGTPAIAVEVSTGNASDPTTILKDATVYLPKIVNMTKPGTGWASQGIGVRIVNTSECNIFIKNTNNFAVGALITSFGTGNVYNNYFIQSLENNGVNLTLCPGDATAWVNENNIYGGRFSHYSGEGTGVTGTRHIQTKMFSSLGTVPNNNVFYKPSIEGGVCEYNVECEGSSNSIMFGRWEATSPKVLYNSVTSSSGCDNVIFYGYDSDKIVFTLTGVSVLGNHLYSAHKGSKIGLNQPQIMTNYSSSSNPIIMGFASNTAILNKDGSATDFAFSLSANLWKFKRSTDSTDRLQIDLNSGRIYFGEGTVSPTAYFGAFGTQAAFRGSILNFPDMTYLLPLIFGSATRWWLDTVGNFRSKPSAGSSDTDGFPFMQMRSGVTGSRPTTGLYIGYPYFDTTLGYMVNVKSLGPTVWVNGAGTSV